MLVPYTSPRKAVPRRAHVTQSHEAYAFPAPQKGLDFSQPLPGGNPMTAVVLENLIPRVLGVALRAGYTRWVSNLNGEVRTVMQYIAPDGTEQLLAATSTGDIYDVTAQQISTFTPVPIDTIAGGQPDGEWSTFNFVTPAGVHRLLMVNPGNGYYIYDGTTITQVLAGDGTLGTISGIDPVLFVHVTVYQNRVWFVEVDSTRAWYLPIGEFAGIAKQFDFGAMLPHGGHLEVLVNWTFDGSSGVGLNNQLVAIGNEGDLVVYGGDDPDTADSFRCTGRWFIGRVPLGRRWFSIFSGDIIMLSERGMNFMSEVMRGKGFFGNTEIAQSVNSALAAEVVNTLDVRYWEVVYLPVEQLVLINRAEFDAADKQWLYEVNNKAFATLQGIPMNTLGLFDGKAFSGDLAGNIWWAFQGGSDGIIDGVAGKDLEGRCVTAFQTMGEGIRVKRFLMVRPSFIAKAPPGVSAALNREWSTAPPSDAPAFFGVDPALWDVGQWNVAVWTGEGEAYESWFGAAGIGRYASLSLRVRANAGAVFVGWQAIVTAGGVL